jgi:hypothetical protein
MAAMSKLAVVVSVSGLPGAFRLLAHVDKNRAESDQEAVELFLHDIVSHLDLAGPSRKVTYIHTPDIPFILTHV